MFRELHEQGRGAARERTQEAQGDQGRIPDPIKLQLPSQQAAVPRWPLTVQLRASVPQEPGKFWSHSAVIIATLLIVWSAALLSPITLLSIPQLPLLSGQEQEHVEHARGRVSCTSSAITAPSSPVSSLAPLSATGVPNILGDSAGDSSQASVHGSQVGQVSGSIPDTILRRPGEDSHDLKALSLTCRILDVAAARVLEGPVPAAPVSVVRGLGHLPHPQHQSSITLISH